jgi:hypothetical protein
MGTNGPVAAMLVGLDGTPTSSIPLFRLPGLSTSAILLQADASAVGQGTVTVEVKSMTTGQSVTPTATVTVGNSTPIMTPPTQTATSTSTPTSTSTSSQPPLVTMTSASLVKKKIKHRHITEIVIGFSGALDASEAQELGIYRLVKSGRHGSFTARNARSLKLKSVLYDPSSNTVALIPQKRLVVRKNTLLQVDGLPPSGLEDTWGRLIDGTDSGQPGGNATAVFSRHGVTLNAFPSGTTQGQTAPTAAAVDALLGGDQLG